MPASFDDQLAVVDELLHEVGRMERGEKRSGARRAIDDYERELRLAGLAQRVAQSYTIIEGVLAFVARRIDRSPVAGEDWHKQLIARCARPRDEPKRPALLSPAVAADLVELCEFRHVVRNIYPTRLDEPRVRENLERLVRAARAFGAECRVFATGLSRVRKPKPPRRSARG
jgi:hypothetical protein